MGCFYCDEHHEGREAIMFKVGDMKAGTLYLFKDQAHKGRCALALKSHKKELCECDEQERNDYCADLAAASGAIKKLWGCTKINLGSFGDSNPHLHFHIVPKYEGGFEFGGSFAITNPEPVFLKDEEYQEMISALRKELGFKRASGLCPLRYSKSSEETFEICLSSARRTTAAARAEV